MVQLHAQRGRLDGVVDHAEREERSLQSHGRLDRADAVDIARVAVFQHQGVPGFFRRDPAFEAGLAEFQALAQNVGVFGQAGEAGAGQDGQFKQVMKVGGAGGANNEH
ncbi:hypothetical protein FQZ97_907180 [compost metagenome]